MKVRLFLLVCIFACLASFCFVSHAEVIDRIIAVVDGHIMTLSDLRREQAIRRQLGDRPVEDNHILAGQLIENYLIETQIADYPNIDVTDAEVDSDFQKLKLVRVTAPGSDKTRTVLADETGRILEVSEPQLRDAVRQRIRIQKFFDMKFRQLIRPSDDDIRKYYEEVFVPEARQRGLQSVPPLSNAEMADAIRENVIQERLDHEVTVWLEAIRRRSNIEIFD